MRIILLVALLLSGSGNIPSFYDDNESLLAVNVRYEVSQLNCEKQIRIKKLKKSVDVLALYSESKGSQDVYKLVLLMKETSDGLYIREAPSVSYCNLKKKALQKQSDDIARAIMRRY